MNVSSLLGRLYRLIRALLILACVLTALAILVGRSVLPYTAALAPQLEIFLEAATDHDWTIEGLSGEWQHFKPIIRIESLSVQPIQQQSSPSSSVPDTVVLTEAVLQVDLLASLTDLQWRVSQFKANKIKLPLRHNDRSGWQLAVLESSHNKNTFAWIDFYHALKKVDIQQLEWRLLSPDVDQNSTHYQSHSVQLKFHAANGSRQLEISSLVETNKNRVVLQSRGDLGHQNLQLKAYVTANNWNLSPLMSAIDKDKFGHWQAENWSGQIWLNKDINQDWQAVAVINEGSLSSFNSSSTLNNISIRAGVSFRPEQHLELRWHDFTADWNQQAFNPSSAEIVLKGQSNQWHSLMIRSPVLDIGQLSQLVNSQTWMSKKNHELISALNINGRLLQVELTLPLTEKLPFSGKAILEDGEISAWNGIPGVKQANIYLEASQNEGFLQVSNQSQLEIFFPKIYREPLVFSKAKAQINWAINNQRLLLNSDVIDFSLRDDSSDYAGRFSLNSRLTTHQEASQISLEIGILNGQGKELPKLLPYTLPTKTLSWLNDTELAADIIDGGFIYHGSLEKSKKSHRSTQLYLNVADASLRFDRKWPKVEQLDGLFIMNNSHSSMIIPNASVEKLSMVDAEAFFDVSHDGSLFSIQAPVTGSIQHAFNALQKSPLKLDFISALQDWDFTGDLHQAHMQLEIPIGQTHLSTEKRVKPTVDVKAVLIDTSIDMNNINASIKALHGPLRFTSSQGLVAKRLTGQLWGEPINLILGDYDLSDEDAKHFPFQLDATTTVTTERLSNWLRLPILSMADGQTAISLRFENTVSGPLLSIDSELQGVLFDLPSKLKKDTAESARLSLQWRLNLPDQPMVVSIEDRLTAQLNFQQFQFQRGGFYLGSDDAENNLAAYSNQHGLTVSGRLKTANLDEWLATYQRYDSIQSAAALIEEADSARTDEKKNTELTITELSVDHALAFEQSFTNARVDFARYDNRWQFAVSSDQLSGTIRLPEKPTLLPPNNFDHAKNELKYTQQQRLLIDLDYFKFTSATAQEESSLSQLLDFQRLEPASIGINELWLDDKPFGSWKFLLSPTASSLLLHDITARVDGVAISSSISNGLRWSIDDEKNHSSNLSIKMQSHNLDELIAIISDGSTKSPLSSRSSQLLIDLAWPASPEKFSLGKSSGSLAFDFDDGKFLTASSSTEGFLKLVSLINFDTLVRRMKLNVSGIYSEGLSFEELSGRLDLSKGEISFIDRPIHVLSPSSEFLMSGTANLNTSMIDANLIATLPLKANLPWFAALAGGLPMAAGVYIATKLFDNEIDRFASAVYVVEGTLSDPQLRFDQVFDNKKVAKD